MSDTLIMLSAGFFGGMLNAVAGGGTFITFPALVASGVPVVMANATSTVNLLAFNKKTLQYRMHCEQPLNSRLFLEEFFMSYAAILRTT